VRFWDASALVPLVTQDRVSAILEKLYGDGSGIWVWWVTPVEIASSIARRERSRELSAQTATQAYTTLARMGATWHEVLPGEPLRESAKQLLRIHPLRSADSLQLASALALAASDLEPLEFVSCDARLADAAARQGLTVLPV
jgi:predicted nucleic acid-binding protein